MKAPSKSSHADTLGLDRGQQDRGQRTLGLRQDIDFS